MASDVVYFYERGMSGQLFAIKAERESAVSFGHVLLKVKVPDSTPAKMGAMKAVEVFKHDRVAI